MVNLLCDHVMIVTFFLNTKDTKSNLIFFLRALRVNNDLCMALQNPLCQEKALNYRSSLQNEQYFGSDFYVIGREVKKNTKTIHS